MEWLQLGVATLGKAPVGVIAAIALAGLWLVARRITTVTLVLASLAAGALTMIWLAWPIALVIAIAVCEICALTALARIALGLVLWPLAVWAMWYAMRVALDGWWAFGLAMLAAWAIGSVLLRFVVSPHRAPHQWLKRRFS
jgi:hypothetical protein